MLCLLFFLGGIMKKSVLVSCILTGITLTACNSGGSSGGDPDPTPDPSNNNATVVKTLGTNEAIIEASSAMNPNSGQIVYPTATQIGAATTLSNQALTLNGSTWSTTGFNTGGLDPDNQASYITQCSMTYNGNTLCSDPAGGFVEMNANTGATINTYALSSAQPAYMSNASTLYTLNRNEVCDLTTETCTPLTGSQAVTGSSNYSVNGNYIYSSYNNFPAAPILKQINMSNNTISYYTYPSNVGTTINSMVVFSDDTHFYATGLKSVYKCNLVSGNITCDNGTTINSDQMTTMNGETLAIYNGKLYVSGTKVNGSSRTFMIYQLNI